MISIVVCTRNRASFLPDTLSSYENIATDTEWELIVVNNGSTDQTAHILEEFSSRTALPLKIVDEQRPGLCRARNAGWRAASGEVVAFTDDDCYPTPDFVNCIHENFKADIGFLGGRVLLHDPMDAPITIQLSMERVVLPPRTFIESGLIHGANLAARKQVLHALQGFDEHLGAGTRLPAGDDADFVNRASFAGFTGVYDPRPAVRHHHRRRTPEQISALTAAYDTGRGAHFAKGMLDKLRRSQYMRQWYWRSVLPAYKSKRNARKLTGELMGAVRYFLLRIKLKLRNVCTHSGA